MASESEEYSVHGMGHSPEDIVFCVDADSQADTELKSAGSKGQPLTRLDGIKQALFLFVHSKLTICPSHRFAIATIGQSASWHLQQFVNDFEAIKPSIQSLKSQGSYQICDLSTLFQLVLPAARASKQQGRILRVILIYCRSDIVPSYNPTLPDKQNTVTFDALYLHDKPSPLNCPQQVYDGLVDILERVSANGYIYESGSGLSRVLFRHICQLLAHPQQRGVQDDSLPKDLSKTAIASPVDESIHKNLSSRWQSRPASIRLEHIPFPLDIPTGMTAENQASAHEWQAACGTVQENVELLLSKLSPAPNCLVADFGWSAWCVPFSRKLGIKSVIYFPGAAAWASLHLHVDLLVREGDAFQDEYGGASSESDKVIDYIPGINKLRVKDLPDYMTWRHFKAPAVEYMACRDSDFVLVNSLVELEPRTFEALGCKYVGVAPLFSMKKEEVRLPQSLRGEDNACLGWLNNRGPKSVLYVCLGSAGYISEEAFSEFSSGLESSKSPFLWMVRPDTKDALGESLTGFVDRTRDQGLVTTWVPQLDVLSHGSVRGFLSHCGWNSVLESILNGVPVLGWPFHAEQRLNCKIMEEHGFGRRLMDGKQVNRAEVEVSIVEFMGENEAMESIRAQVRQFKSQFRTAALDSSAQLQRFMANIV